MSKEYAFRLPAVQPETSMNNTGFIHKKFDKYLSGILDFSDVHQPNTNLQPGNLSGIAFTF